MKKQPQEMMLVSVNALLMPNGEILCEGETIGKFSKVGKHVEPVRWADGRELTDDEKEQLV